MIVGKSILPVLFLCFFWSCGTVKKGSVPWEKDESVSVNNSPSDSTSLTLLDEMEFQPGIDKPAHSFVEPDAPDNIQQRQEFLQLAYKDWKGAPYLLGGSGYTGIDCSAFMQVIFEDYFSMMIPRTTLEQLREGTLVKPSEIKPGDLTFFKTGRNTFHVGVMINKKEFLHASVSNGVTVSQLSHPYWAEAYFTTKRLF